MCSKKGGRTIKLIMTKSQRNRHESTSLSSICGWWVCACIQSCIYLCIYAMQPSAAGEVTQRLKHSGFCHETATGTSGRIGRKVQRELNIQDQTRDTPQTSSGERFSSIKQPAGDLLHNTNHKNKTQWPYLLAWMWCRNNNNRTNSNNDSQ